MQKISFSEFFAFSLLKITLDSSNQNSCWFNWRNHILHPAVYATQDEYQDRFELYDQPHFCTMGAYIHSSELNEVISRLIQSGMIEWLSPNTDHKFRRPIRVDSEKFFEKWLEETFGDDSDALRAFEEYCTALKEEILFA